MSEPVLLVYRRLDKAHTYVAALEAAGLSPKLRCADQDSSLEGLGGLVLMGGTDVDPQLYGEQRQSETAEPDRQRDDLELALIGGALDRDLPVLAICRGLQVLNVAHGGTLVQHLPTHARHRRTGPDPWMPAHEIRIEADSLLGRIARARTWAVNSRHHQAVKKLGAGLRVTAVDTEDGTVEALERPDKRFVLGVQWHPEEQAPRDAAQAELFAAFAERVGTTR